jgi:hypothetical protein
VPSTVYPSRSKSALTPAPRRKGWIRTELIRPLDFKGAMKALANQVVGPMLKERGQNMVEALEEVVDNWEHKPDFKASYSSQAPGHTAEWRRTYVLWVRPTGDPDAVKIFWEVDSGTKEHVIPFGGARKGKYLIFPFTGPGAQSEHKATRKRIENRLGEAGYAPKARTSYKNLSTAPPIDKGQYARFKVKVVHHPGVTARKFMEEVADLYQFTTKDQADYDRRLRNAFEANIYRRH